jgi:light-regulated signal transduction histidine kinase (bacteriophytochrome)
MEKDKQEEIYQAFKEEVNMTPASLEKWLETDESKSVGWDSGDGESIGHKSGERIVELLGKKKAELTDADYEHMQEVHGYIKRHMAQRPHDPENSNWDYSLRNWGHDFSKK